jgi:chlorobactene glucosyltransferase
MSATTGAVAGVLASLPWWLAIVASWWRWRGSPSLEQEPRTPPQPPPSLRVVVPARDEAAHIGDCVRRILASEYPALELVVVDDHSSDGTAALAREAAAGDPRLTLVEPPPLPRGWLGKQWACAHGAAGAAADFLLFTDADVRHAPDLHARLVHAARHREAHLVTIAGFQETHTFWERVVQPFVFAILALWYGGPATVNRSRHPRGKIANGQCLLFERRAYDAFGGHAAVRGRAAEDLAFAQGMSAAGYRVHLALGEDQMSTRMYDSLGAIVAGWKKNVYAAGRETLPAGRLGRAMARLLVPGPALLARAPPVTLVWGMARHHAAATAFGASASAALLVVALAVGRQFRIAPWYALAFPLGAAVYLYIALAAVLRGDRVRWKARDYRVGDSP